MPEPSTFNPTPSTAHAASVRDVGLLASAVRVVSGFTLLSRFAGLARDILIGRILGDTAIGSAFAAAYGIPNFFRRLFGEGALSAAFLPEYTLARRDDPARARALAARVLRALVLVTSLVTLVIEAALFIRLVARPADAELALSLRLIMLLIPMMPLVCTTAILGGMLQARGRFAVPAATPILLNVLQILAGGYFVVRADPTPTRATYWIGAAALCASVLAVAWSAWALRGELALRDGVGAGKAAAKNVLARFLPSALGLGTLQLNTMLDTLIAMWPVWVGATMFGRPCPLDGTSGAILRFTQTLYQFPLGVFGIAVATALFPLLSRTADKPEAFLAHLRRGVRLSLFIGLPASVGLWLVRDDLLRTLYSGGSKGFSAEGLTRCAAVLAGFAPAVWAYSLNQVLTRAFYSLSDTRTPMKIAIACVLLNATLNFTLIWLLSEAGLAWATAISACVQTMLLWTVLRARLAGRVLDATTRAGVLKVCVVSLAMACAVWVVLRVMPAPASWKLHAMRAAGAVTVGMGVYAGLAWAWKCPEIRWLTQRAPRGVSGERIEMNFE